MRRSSMITSLGSLVAAPALLAVASSSAHAAEARSLADFEAADALGRQHLATFDTLDFVVFSGQEWGRLHESHSHDIRVHWPDGHVAIGIERHIADLKALFVYAPDTRIKEHPVRMEMGEWTSVIGYMRGTFTKPMPLGNGKSIAPTGKAFDLAMCTVGHWKNGVMDEEYLFWDSATYLKQMGVT